MQFSRKHSATLLKYLWVSFITGAISHGFFSTGRSLLTALLGVIFFSVGHFLEISEHSKDLWRNILLSALLAVAIGAVTWWLQHFPDSPERSLWILPLGYALSIWVLAYIDRTKFARREWIYTFASLLLVLALSGGLYNYYDVHHLNIEVPGSHPH